jgi:Co/Zn/Cd efflux system component
MPRMMALANAASSPNLPVPSEKRASSAWRHHHAFLGAHHHEHERRTWSVVALTALMMVVEITGGTVFGSLALVADGWHMATHVAALSKGRRNANA